MYNFEILGSCPSLKNNKVIVTKPFPRLVPSSRVQAWNKSAKEQLEKLGLNNENIDFPIKMSIWVFKDSERRFDVDNVASTVMDLLTHEKFYLDDSQVYELHVYKCQADKENPRVKIMVDEYELHN